MPKYWVHRTRKLEMWETASFQVEANDKAEAEALAGEKNDNALDWEWSEASKPVVVNEEIAEVV
jgi:hypothetical protein